MPNVRLVMFTLTVDVPRTVSSSSIIRFYYASLFELTTQSVSKQLVHLFRKGRPTDDISVVTMRMTSRRMRTKTRTHGQVDVMATVKLDSARHNLTQF